MIKINNIKVFGWDAAIRGMRNPMNSWDKSDSYSHTFTDIDNLREYTSDEFHVGENDLKLMQKLVKAGSDHSKFMRMINASMDIIAPLYWWKEFDTYKVGTVANSCSTMHKIHAKEFALDDFSHERLFHVNEKHLIKTIELLNEYREEFNKAGDKKYWWQMIQLLPSSYNQKRTVQMNYQVAQHIYNARKDHKLDEWQQFCSLMLNELPYFAETCDIE